MRDVPRWLHPGAWWAWALGLAAAASNTTNPLLLIMLILVAALVVQARRPEAPWGRSFAFFLKLGIVVVIVRVAVQVLFGASIGTTELVSLPGVGLPSWLAGIRLGGDVTLESILMALYDGLRLATILICVGAANSLASPTRLLKSVPAELYDLGVAGPPPTPPPRPPAGARPPPPRRRGAPPTSGPRAIAGAAVPVLEGALERSVTLAAAMDSRGYGRRGTLTVGQRRLASAALLGGLVAACIGAYGLVSAGSPALLGLPMLVLGLAASAIGVVVSSRTSLRTRYRPDPWRGPEWLVLGAGIAVAGLFAIADAVGVPGMHTPVDPPAWPTLPLVAVIGLLLAVTPAWTAPALPTAEARHRDARPADPAPLAQVTP